MRTDQIHSHPAPQTQGRTISWASLYDLAVWLLSFGKTRAIREATVDLAPIKPGDKVLDVGCGTGDLALAAKASVGSTGEVYGIDASPEMVAVAQRKATKNGVEVAFQVDWRCHPFHHP